MRSTSPSSLNRAALAALVAGLTCLALPAVAAADSVVYVKGGNVWSAQPDGSGAVQLTDGDGWHSPTQSDDGTIAAVRGTNGKITVMRADGRPLREITTAHAPTSNGGTFAPRPVELSFSPDGTKIAYAYVQFSCPPASTCRVVESTFYTEAGVTTATPHATWGNQFSAHSPEWVSNSRTLVGAGSRIGIDDLDAGDYNYPTWMQGNVDLGDPELTRDGTRLATTFDYGANTRIGFWAVTGDVKAGPPPGEPAAACNTSAGDQQHADPSWSPDGSSVAYQHSGGIQVVRFSKLDAAGCEVSADALAFPGGTSPDWGPSEPPAARYTDTPADPAPVTPTPAGPRPVTPAKPAPAPSVASAAAPAAAPEIGSASGGAPASPAASRAVRLRAKGPGTVTVRLTLDGKRVGSGSATARKAGALTVRLTGARLAGLRGRTVRMTAVFTPRRGGRPTTTTRSLRLA